ncbi:MAG: VCBS repeat-containing protein, partial [Phycisphaerales bacterium]|nr:VCBS repeat-containing protein [Phycisphaerales bacterium]
MSRPILSLLIALFACLTTPAQALNVSVAPNTIPGGNLAVGTITNAPSGGTVFIWTDGPGISVPGSVTLPPFVSTTNFFVTTSPVSQDVNANVYVGFLPSVAADAAPVTVTAPRIATLIASPDVAPGGSTVQLAVSLTSPAPANTSVALAADSDEFAAIPDHIDVPYFSFTGTVSIPTIGVNTPGSMILTATRLDSSAAERVTLIPARLDAVELLTEEALPGTQVMVRIHMEGEPVECGRNLVVNATSSSRGAEVVVPPGARVPPGETTVDIPVIIPNLSECQVVTVTVFDPLDDRQVSRNIVVRGLNDEIEFNLPFLCNATTPVAVAVGDFDGDGDQDALSAIAGDGLNDPGVQVYNNDGIGRLPEDSDWGYTDDAMREVIDMEAADLVGNDNLPDVALLNRTNAAVTVLRNRRGSFDRAFTAATEGRPLALAVGDIDNNGIRDIVVTSETLDSIEVLRSTGTAATSTGPVSSGHFPVDVVTGRFNDDPWLDAATACIGVGNVGQVGLHFANSSAVLSTPTLINLDAPALTLAAGDFDLDGDDDIAVCTAAAEIIILINRNGFFEESERHAIAGNASDIRAGDVESDGDIDLVYACPGLMEAGVLLNAGCGLFDPPDPIMMPVDSGPRLALGHLNTDDRLDLMLTRPDADQVLEILQLPPPCATYIVMSIHGQDGSGFNPFWNEDLPTSPHGWPNAATNPATPQGPMFPLLDQFVDEINYIRTERAGLCPIRLMTHEFDWVAMTGRGQRMILASRISFMMTFLTVNDLPLLAAGAISETLGRLQTRTASREAAGQVIADLDELVEQARYLDPLAPIFIDIVCHSRGTTVTSEVLSRLVDRGPLPLGENVSLSVSYISVIEPLFPFGILRPGVSAGDLMGDPYVDRHASATRIAHFHENRACVTMGGVCVGGQYFDNGFFNWLLGLGADMPVDALVEYAGYPKSIGDPSLMPDVDGLIASDHNSIVAEFCFIEPIEIGNPATIPVGPSGPGVPAHPQFNFAWTSYFGEMMSDPTQEIPEPTQWPGMAVRSTEHRGTPDELITDPDLNESAGLVVEADAIFADPEIAPLFTGDIAATGAELQRICADRWPASGAWQAPRPDVQAGDEAGD